MAEKEKGKEKEKKKKKKKKGRKKGRKRKDGDRTHFHSHTPLLYRQWRMGKVSHFHARRKARRENIPPSEEMGIGVARAGKHVLLLRLLLLLLL